ncbi:sphingomyelin phosphodiesterase-like isoform X2 [Agrilus planipennis]|uniref:Sphingomyelin phosphodiesterase n=1 Tax=Agrilus planipennis TaxID=224129 RepID=A0A7F5R708_AGRPL|nr:sphingomyelin phosphodiesterase-like isoform X2 [Agrilus planipennis]
MRPKLLLFVVSFTIATFALSESSTLQSLSEDVAEAKLQRAFNSYFLNKDDSALNEMIDQIQMPELMREYGEITSFGIGNNLVCTACRTSLDALLLARKKGITEDELFVLLSKLCIDMGIQTETVCYGVLEEHLGIGLYIADNGQNVTGKWACSLILQKLNCPKVAGKDWSIQLDNRYGPELSEQYSSNIVKILHISDLHYDAMYTPGSNAECNNPVCCGPDSGKVANALAQAGYWGDYRDCDTPWHSIVNTFDNIKATQQDLAYVYLTGDIISHRVWMTSKSDNTKYLLKGYNLIDQYFSSSQIFPILGNHEPHPLNQYAPESITGEYSTKWLFSLIQHEWSKWLPESTYETIKRGGYYTVKVNNKFRIIALNSNVCYTANFWLLYDNGDIYGQLKWLRDVLSEAEMNSESVHILGHIPTGSSICYETWAREYRRIITRYARNIKAIFNGHTHKNEFELFYNTSESSNPILMAFNGGSLTTYSDLNPNYIVYNADAESLDILDAETYIYNLTSANLAGRDSEPEWYKLYSFRECYGIHSLRRSELNNFVENMAKNKTTKQLYYRNKYLNSDPILKAGCDDSCLMNHLCETVTSLSGDTSHCTRLQEIWDTEN